MKIKSKRFLTYCLSLSLICSTGIYSNPAFAKYAAPDSYNRTIDGNSGGARMTIDDGLETVGYDFENIKQSPSSKINGGALNFKAIFDWTARNRIKDFVFKNNSGYDGGAMYGSSEDMMAVEIENTGFISNSSENDGGAYYSTTLTQISDSSFEGNEAKGKGGAYYLRYDGQTHMISNTDFINNKSGKEGGAIYVDSNGDYPYLMITANDDATHYMSGNIQNVNNPDKEQSSNAIFIEENGEVLLGSYKNTTYIIDDGIEGQNIDNTTLSVETGENAKIFLNNQIKNLILNIKSGNIFLNHGNKLKDGLAILDNADLSFGDENIKLNIANDKLDNLSIGKLTIEDPDKVHIALDVDLNQGKSDIFNVSKGAEGSLKFDAEHFEFNIINDGDIDKFQLFDGVDSSFLTGELIQFSESGKYKFIAGENGAINVLVQDSSGLSDAVKSSEETRRFVAQKDIKIDESLGAMGGKSLTINMKENNLDGNNNQGITVNNSQTLAIENAGNGNNGAANNFKTDNNGAFINNIGGTVNITDSTISDNKAGEKGGAIYSLGGEINLNADTKDVIFKNNTHEINNSADTAGNKNDIYLENAADGTKAQLNINGTKNTVLESGISGNGTINKNDTGVMKLGGDNSSFDGDVYLNNGTIELLSGASYFNAQNTFAGNNSRVNLINNNPNDVINFGNLNLNGTVKVGIDIDSINQLNDKIGAASVSGDGKILIDNINIMSIPNREANFDIIMLDEATKNSPLLGNVEISPNAANVTTPIFKYHTSFNPETGRMSFSAGSRNNKNSYNPAILATPVALQLAAQAGIKEAVNYAFEHSDSYTKLPLNQRLAELNSNKYAISEFNEQLPSYEENLESNALWVRPYTVFEEVNLKHGPKVDNISYGTLIGFDSLLKKRRNGWISSTSSFLGYHGSSLDYSNVDISSNGIVLGATKNYYKRNFWSALTLSGSTGLGRISEMYGNDDIAHLSAALSSKTGYNMEFADGKLIIQPNISLSYYMSKVFDYKNAANIRISSDPLHSFELRPGVRIIGNIKGGWQPYLSAAMVWNLFNDTNVMANGFKLPEMPMKTYVEYGLGIQKTKKDGFICYLQSLIRNGGRTGVALMGGVSWSIGRKEKNKEVL